MSGFCPVCQFQSVVERLARLVCDTPESLSGENRYLEREDLKQKTLKNTANTLAYRLKIVLGTQSSLDITVQRGTDPYSFVRY